MGRDRDKTNKDDDLYSQSSDGLNPEDDLCDLEEKIKDDLSEILNIYDLEEQELDFDY